MARQRSTEDDYAREGGVRDQQARRSRERAAIGKDIGPCPARVNEKRWLRCRKNLKTFCITYLKARFFLKWSADHLSALKKLQACGLKGGLFGFAMPRGCGKTALSEATALWSLLYGHRRFVLLVGATEQHAVELLEGIQVTLETNDMLAEDFPEVCHPIRALEGISNRANGQTCRAKEDDPPGPRTRITWTHDEIVFPTLAGSAVSGSVLRVAGLTGRVRGQRSTTADGETIRPDFVIVDDPQTDESARSPVQNATRERLLSGAILGLAGPKSKIAVVMPTTIIAPGDMADRILDNDRHPQWQGSRAKLLPTFPTDLALWEQYASLRKDGMADGADCAAATAFYKANREAMDAGAVVAWPERYLPGQLSALQYAMDLWIDNPHAFFAEYQNAPLSEAEQTGIVELTADEVAAKLSQLPRGMAPRETTRLTAGIDIQGACLFWLVTAWCEDFGGSIVSYGAYPQQSRDYFAAADARPSLADIFPGLAESARIYAALSALVEDLAGRSWPREDDADGVAPLRLERILIDANWHVSTGPVYELCRKSAHHGILLPSHGKGIVASMNPMRDWARRPGERVGRDWKISLPQAGRGRHVIIDSNSWKTFLHERLRVPDGQRSGLWLPGKHPHEHQLLADHITAEYRVKTFGRGREVEEWKERPGIVENHWLDCGVLSAVAASVQGLVWSAAAAAGEPAAPRVARKGMSHREMYEAKHKEGARQ